MNAKTTAAFLIGFSLGFSATLAVAWGIAQSKQGNR